MLSSLDFGIRFPVFWVELYPRPLLLSLHAENPGLFISTRSGPRMRLFRNTRGCPVKGNTPRSGVITKAIGVVLAFQRASDSRISCLTPLLWDCFREPLKQSKLPLFPPKKSEMNREGYSGVIGIMLAYSDCNWRKKEQSSYDCYIMETPEL